MKIGQTHAAKALWITLGLVMLVAGLNKLFVFGAEGVTGMMGGVALFGVIPLFAWAPAFWAWVLIIAEIATGIMILARWNMKYVTIIPMIILAVATFANNWMNWGGMVQHLALIAGYWLIGIIYSK